VQRIRIRPRTRILVGLCVAAATASSCAGASDGSSTSSRRVLTVFAASSLAGAFDEIGSGFEAAHPGTTVTFNFGGSDDLAGQIDSEGVADVFASASPAWMDDVDGHAGVSDRVNFARNKLVIITPPDDPAGVSTYADLGKPGVQIVLGAGGVPVGDYARESLRRAGLLGAVEPNVVSNEEDDAWLVAKIRGGEADAAIVYASDVTPAIAADVRAVPIPASDNVVATYPIAIVDGTTERRLATSFIDYVTGTPGTATLRRFGFLPPPPT
jgi:molybdate transport system substrate-binding protein